MLLLASLGRHHNCSSVSPSTVDRSRGHDWPKSILCDCSRNDFTTLAVELVDMQRTS